MSSITFTTRSEGEANVRGPERALAGITCMGLFTGQLDLHDFRLAQLFPADSYMRRLALDRDFPAGPVFATHMGTHLKVGDDAITMPDGRVTNAFGISLNTAILLGNDVVRFLARLHGQCEVHGWVAGKNRAWLAGIIEDGRSSGILRADMGWESVIDLLRGSNRGAVVTSYSVTDSFPNPSLAGFKYDEAADNDPWEELSALPKGEQWRRCVRALRGHGLEWKPDDWATIRFGEDVTAFDVRRAVADLPRLDEATNIIARTA